MRRFAFLLPLAAALLSDSHAYAHGEEIPSAPIVAPQGVGNAADESYVFSWTDEDISAPGAQTTIDFFYTSMMPPTFPPGSTSPLLEGKTIALGVRTEDMTNTFRWDTSSVAAGNYWLWSVVNDPAPEHEGLRWILFSPGVVSVGHGVDQPGPAVVLMTPDNPFDVADAEYVIRYEAFDPAGTGTVKLEARPFLGEEYIVVADRLPPGSRMYAWNTSMLPEGEHVLRATISDDRGRAFTAYGRFIVLVARLTPIIRDGGTGDGGASSSGGGCSCSASRRRSHAATHCAGLFFLLMVVRRTGRPRSSASPRRDRRRLRPPPARRSPARSTSCR